MGIISLSVDGEPINNVREGTQLVIGGPPNPVCPGGRCQNGGDIKKKKLTSGWGSWQEQLMKGSPGAHSHGPQSRSSWPAWQKATYQPDLPHCG